MYKVCLVNVFDRIRVRQLTLVSLNIDFYINSEPRFGLVLASTTESVLQKFRKTFSLKFQQKKQGGSKESCGSDVGDNLSEILAEPSEEESPQHVPSLPLSPSSNCPNDSKDENTEQKYR